MTGVRAPEDVVVTGVGAFTTVGGSAEAFWQACLAGRGRVEPIPEHWRNYFEAGSRYWSPLSLPEFRARGLTRVELTQHDPVALIAALATAEALARAGLECTAENKRQNTLRINGVDPHRAGVFLGSGIGGASTLLGMHSHQMLAGHFGLRSSAPDADGGRAPESLVYPARFNPFSVSMSMPNAASAYLGIKYGLRGANETVCTACASGTSAIGRAYRAVSSGLIDMALAGGSEYLDDHYGGFFRGFDAARTLVRGEFGAEQCNRPFDRRRGGFLFSQGGAGMLVLERGEHARARGAPVLARIGGFQESFDAHSMMSLEPSGREILRMISGVLAQAGLQPTDVGYVNAHGTGTELNDQVEAELIERAFGAHAYVNSTKSILGHTIGASGALEAIATVLSVSEQRLHPSANIDEPLADLRFVTEATSVDIEHAFTQSFAFGGHNAALVVSRAES